MFCAVFTVLLFDENSKLYIRFFPTGHRNTEYPVGNLLFCISLYDRAYCTVVYETVYQLPLLFELSS